MLSLRRQGFDPKRAPSNKPSGHVFANDAARWRCGARAGRMNATIPLVTVTFDDQWLHVEGVPTYDIWIDREVVGRVDTIRFLWSPGIRFAADAGVYDGLIIWTRGGMAEALRQARWPA